jgi:hypothetical protein
MTAQPAWVDDLAGMDSEHEQMAFELLHFRAFVRTLKATCKCPAPTHILTEGPHPGERRRVECGGCGAWLAWLPKLKNKDRRSSNSTGLAQGTFCQCCRKTGVNLVGHHVIEVEEGGSNEPANIWTVCEPCHTVIHALRRMASASDECRHDHRG